MLIAMFFTLHIVMIDTFMSELCRQSKFRLKGIPVLFIPGSAGSYKQGLFVVCDDDGDLVLFIRHSRIDVMHSNHCVNHF